MNNILNKEKNLFKKHIKLRLSNCKILIYIKINKNIYS